MDELEEKIFLLIEDLRSNPNPHKSNADSQLATEQIMALIAKREKALLDKTMGEVEELFNDWYGLKHLTSDSAAGDFRLALQAMKVEKRDE